MVNLLNVVNPFINIATKLIWSIWNEQQVLHYDSQSRAVSIITNRSFDSILWTGVRATQIEMSKQNSQVTMRCVYIQARTYASMVERTIWKRNCKTIQRVIDIMQLLCSFAFHYLLFNVHPSFTLRSFSTTFCLSL